MTDDVDTRLRRAASRIDRAEQERAEAIRAAREAGKPLRHIAELIRLSPEWVRRIAEGTAPHR